MKRVVAGAINAQPHELGGALAAFLCAFAMFSSYSILRPIRETMGLTSGLETLPQAHRLSGICRQRDRRGHLLLEWRRPDLRRPGWPLG